MPFECFYHNTLPSILWLEIPGSCWCWIQDDWEHISMLGDQICLLDVRSGWVNVVDILMEVFESVSTKLSHELPLRKGNIESSPVWLHWSSSSSLGWDLSRGLIEPRYFSLFTLCCQIDIVIWWKLKPSRHRSQDPKSCMVGSDPMGSDGDVGETFSASYETIINYPANLSQKNEHRFRVRTEQLIFMFNVSSI